ncbi:Subtilisin-like protease SBT1.7 [Capsicum baccatum]|uniref:Subtilisin-like protease SBT1.7 n=1 Tax=Capsicum baccatum TaxID=33114 RepID=A0A2G2XPV3_CAPBA|nr:Subtilisin-like protease SBT1.7 [Capsicum baccatum]
MGTILIILLSTINILIFLHSSTSSSSLSSSSILIPTKKTYIVHMKRHLKPPSFSTHHQWYKSHLQSLTSHDNSLLYTYKIAYHGFAARLEPSEVELLRQSDYVINVYEDTFYFPQTTRTPEFLGLDRINFWAGHTLPELNNAAQDVIIGVFDSGIWPESESFSDVGMSNVPSRWRGKCQSVPDFDPNVHCNRKLIGATYFVEGCKHCSTEIQSPRDYNGHGTHTASTAAGSIVANASLFSYAKGIARGMAPQARIASYKVCWNEICAGSDILAAFDRAIMDGVDVLSLSLSSNSTTYYSDAVALGAFAAVEKGILVSCSAGNAGPWESTVTNTAPWVITVGAATLDRDFPATVTLGNGQKLQGVSLYSGKLDMEDKLLSLFYQKGGNLSSNLCLRGSLDQKMVGGKVVLCDRGVNYRVEKGLVVKEANGVGMILANTPEWGEELLADSHLLPAVVVGRKAGDVIREYVKTEKNPTVVLSFGGTVLKVKPSPVMATFSSRGPNPIAPQILKPDIIGPGVNILAAWPETLGPTSFDVDRRKTSFNIMSGTSMSCPHVTGVAALVKAVHPEWSPSAIKSAIMTTAYTQDNTNSSFRDSAVDGTFSNPLAHGSGHVNPQKALSPGLVYNIRIRDHIKFLCSLNYSMDEIQSIVKRLNFTCANKFADAGQINYPSFSVLFGINTKRVVRYTREVTNVGAAGSVYEVAIDAPSSVVVLVKPQKLVFKKVGEKLHYTVTFVSKKDVKPGNAFGWISWNNAKHEVRSPVTYSWMTHLN